MRLIHLMTRRFRPELFLSLTVIITIVWSSELSAEQPTYRVVRNLVYASPGGKELQLDAYIPAGKGPFPGVLVVHGGAWATGNKRQLGRYAKALVISGYAAFSIDYRLAPKHKFPAQIEDCRAAVLWVRKNAAKYSVNPNRIGAVGYSAGGHLVALMGVTGKLKRVAGKPQDTRIQVVCAGGAPCDFREIPENSNSLAYWLGGSRKKVPQQYLTASPAAFVTAKAPPMFFFHGEKDRLVNVSSPKAMAKRLKEHRVHTEKYIRTGAGHIITAIAPECVTRSIDFFNRHLKKRTPKPAAKKPRPKKVSFISPQKTNAKRRPNIVFLLIDDMGWKDVGFMGSRFYETPNIDKLAKQGMIFTNAYSNGPNCAPTRACLMSGQYSPRHGIFTVGSSERGNAKLRKLIPTQNTTTLKDGIVTLTESLQSSGYVTAHFGKWHLGADPTTQGFDSNVAGNRTGSPRGGYFSPYRNSSLPNGPKGEYLTDRLTDEAISFIEKNQQKPFFLYLPHYAVHTPIQAKAALIEKYRKKKAVGAQNHPVYAAMVESVDQSVGRLMSTLEKLKLAENTIVVFTSDNGGYGPATSMSPLRGSKGMLYEGGIRVPLIVRWPGKIKPGSRSDEPVISLDFYPTILDATGTRLVKSHTLDGQSLLPILRQSNEWKPRSLFWHFPAYLQAYRGINRPFRTRPAGAIRKDQYKLIEFFEDGNLELYDLKNDIGEQKNLVQSQPELTRKMHQLMKDWRKSIHAPVPTQKNPRYDSTFKPPRKNGKRRRRERN